ncbi:hypothetical protein Esti_005996 [Eimeria stiedai]
MEEGEATQSNATNGGTSGCCTPCNEEVAVEKEPLFPLIQLSPEFCPHAPHGADPPSLRYIRETLLPTLQQARETPGHHIPTTLLSRKPRHLDIPTRFPRCFPHCKERELGSAAALTSFLVSQAFVVVLVEAYEKGALQDSLRALERARRAGKEKKREEAKRGKDFDQADSKVDAYIAEELRVHADEDRTHAMPNGFQPLLALAEALQRISQKSKTAAATAAATTTAATAAGENPKTSTATRTHGSRNARD